MSVIDYFKLCLHCCLFTCFEINIEEFNPKSKNSGFTLYEYEEENSKPDYKLTDFHKSSSDFKKDQS
jgi:hypothetical protein